MQNHSLHSTLTIYFTFPILTVTYYWKLYLVFSISTDDISIHTLFNGHYPGYALVKDNWAHWIQAPLTYLKSSHNSYLHNLITVQPHCSIHSSSSVTLARPSKSSSLWITDHSFQYASSRLQNQLPASLRQPHTNLSNSASPSSLRGTASISSIDSPLSSSITPSLFHSGLKTFLFCKYFPP